MPVLPAVPSTTVPPGHSCPDMTASWIKNRAARSFTEPPPLQNSAFARISQPVSSLILFNRTSGVLPIIPTSPSRMTSDEKNLLFASKYAAEKRRQQTTAAMIVARDTLRNLWATNKISFQKSKPQTLTNDSNWDKKNTTNQTTNNKHSQHVEAGSTGAIYISVWMWVILPYYSFSRQRGNEVTQFDMIFQMCTLAQAPKRFDPLCRWLYPVHFERRMSGVVVARDAEVSTLSLSSVVGPWSHTSHLQLLFESIWKQTMLACQPCSFWSQIQKDLKQLHI